jgi:hypothetical protein
MLTFSIPEALQRQIIRIGTYVRRGLIPTNEMGLEVAWCLDVAQWPTAGSLICDVLYPWR